MHRRDFLKAFLGTAAGVALAPTLDLERLLWVPGEKTIFLPPPPTIATIEWMTREMLRMLEHQLTFMSHINRQYDDAYRLGDTVQVRQPARWGGPLVPPMKSACLTHQMAVNMAVSIDAAVPSLALPAMLEAASDVLANEIRRRGIDVTGPLPLPTMAEAAIATSPSGLSVRGVRARAFDAGPDRDLVRFDVLGGKLA